MFYEKLGKLCMERGISMTAACQSVGLRSSNLAVWKKGSFPNNSTIRRFVDYFGVPTSYFTDAEKAVTQTINGNGNVAIAGDNNHVETLTESEKTLIALFRRLDPIEQARLMVQIDDLVKEKKK